ncbi:Zn(II)2Cys6 transcription factor [Aspergillus aculeatinus CBS 121060]|uniref:Uncharacterized protein n=1 Tax=Aspergillus aculeatinus CBS 121060 TaxID=1448322 RepID=A0ACD1GYJ2_9EURO|nr:hypothetical protein BO66DRAFT_474277 [Aspergillus aculeatinus CBS 121060]RAH66329.1 hypothetical protein BO66DRAFT_474277 [Aspergillus aculeatinus CBS 121060]
MTPKTCKSTTASTRSARKVRSACIRCRNRRIKCDGETPACRNCLKASAPCIDVDARLGDALLPRSFSADCVRRIQWLEEIIKKHLTHIDLAAGPQLDASIKAAFEVAPPKPISSSQTPLVFTSENDDCSFVPSPEIDYSSQIPSFPGVPNNESPQPDCWESPPGDSDIADEVRALAQSLGQVSLHEDSRQTYYLGTSTGVLFAHLIGASTTGSRDPSGPVVIEEENTLGDVSFERLRTTLLQELPPRDRCQDLLDEYFRVIHPDFPILDPASVSSICEALYALSSLTNPCKIGSKGWPVDRPGFAYNGEMEIRNGQYETSISVYAAAFHLFMIFSIASTLKMRRRQLEDSPQRLYRAAMSFSHHVLPRPSLVGIQSLVLLIAHSLMAPSGVNTWTMVHLCMANCVDIGLHREMAASPYNRLPIHIRRMVFWTVYSLDRSISTIQGRPLGIRDETFDLSRPDLEFSGSTATPGSPFGPSFDPKGLWPYTTHHLALDRWISAIKLLLYRCPSSCQQNLFMWPPDLGKQQAILKGKLQAWYLEIPNIMSQLIVPDEPLRDKLRLKLEARYYAAMMLLFQPSQALRRPNAEACKICYESAVKRLMIYSQLYENEQLFCGWRSMQDIFHSGVTFLYLLYGLPFIRQSVSLPEVSKIMRLCSNLLSTGGEWWPSLKKAKKRLESVADIVIDKLYSVNVAALPAQSAPDMNGGLGTTQLGEPLPHYPSWEFPDIAGLFQPSRRRTAPTSTFPVVSPRRSGTEAEGDGGMPQPLEILNEQAQSDAPAWGNPIPHQAEVFDDPFWELVHLT